jgi:hypothetical protein
MSPTTASDEPLGPAQQRLAVLLAELREEEPPPGDPALPARVTRQLRLQQPVREAAVVAGGVAVAALEGVRALLGPGEAERR